MLRSSLFLCFFICTSFWSKGISAQNLHLSPFARISVLTCGSGQELYSSFGHSAFRVWDPQQDIDWVYNYGTFDFNTPNFYLKFAQGKLNYALSKEAFPNFLYTYQLEQRWVKEQILNLDVAQREALFAFLQENHNPENRFYRYDFLFENCATKIPEVLETVLGGTLKTKFDYLTESHSFRDLIQDNLNTNSWSAFGIDLALGGVIDRKAQPSEYAFLPLYVWEQLDHSTVNDRPLVNKSQTILDIPNVENQGTFIKSPMFCFSILFLLTLWLSMRSANNQKVLQYLDGLLFAITGLAGLVVVFLWFFTDHSSTAWNLNLLWANPLNLIAISFMRPNFSKPIFRRYLLLDLVLLLACPVFWIFGAQVFAPVVLPLWATLALRYTYIIRHLKFVL